MTVTTIGQTTIYVMGKCPIKGCKNRHRVTVHNAPIRKHGPWTYTEWQIPAQEPYGLVYARLSKGSDRHDGHGYNPRPSKWLTVNRHAFDAAWFAAVEAAGWICTDHDRFMVTHEIKGVVNYEKPCTGKCRSAIGPSCECACGGEFHGSNWGL